MAQGENAEIIARRYGVPTDALLKANGATEGVFVQTVAPGGPSASCVARWAITSLAFMLVEVAEPIWKISMGKWGKKKMSGQEPRRHPETPAYRCFLSDLTGFAGLRRAGPTRTGASIPDVGEAVNVKRQAGTNAVLCKLQLF